MVLPWSKTTAFSFASEYVLLTLMEDKIPEGGAMFHFFFFFLNWSLPIIVFGTKWKINIIILHIT